MDKSERKVGTAVGSDFEDENEEQPEREERGPAQPAPAAVPRARGEGGGAFHVLKPGQGVRVRWGSAIGAGVLSLAFAHFIWTQIQVFNFGETYQFYVRTLVPVVLFLALAYLTFWAVGRNPKVIDFMIATEGEMKKVNWSSKKEIWGATRVVIVTVLALAFLLAIVDAVFILFFSTIKVLHFDIFQQFFGGGGT